MLDYGIIGNCKTCALVSKDASIHWMCYPDFESPSVFARLLDNKAGHFSIKPKEKAKCSQRYLPNTNILETIFEGNDFAFRIIDFFPRYKKIIQRYMKIEVNRLVRIVEPIRGKPMIRVKFVPRPDYSRIEPILVDSGTHIAVGKDMALYTNAATNAVLSHEHFELSQRKYFVFGDTNGEYNMKKCLSLLSATRKYWERWVSTLILPEQNREIVIRSALALKLLTFTETGAIIAAATTSIPEELGGERCWDYRYCWVRDAAFCADAFKKIGRDYESKKLMEFIIGLALKNDYIQPIYSIRGETKIKEETLEHLEGFKGSSPVRVGNAAYNQMQHDIYGEIIDIIYLYFVYYEYEKKMTKRYWRFLKYAVNQIKFNWDRKDSGIWEFRGINEHYTFSKLMCWVGLDRAIRIAQHFKEDQLALDWSIIRAEVRQDVLNKGFNLESSAFTIHYGSKELDAANLLMAYFEFLENTDPRLINTIKASFNQLRQGPLVQRYSVDDDFGKSRSAFSVCSFWLADALRYIGETEKAETIYQGILRKCNRLGLYSEDIDIETGDMTGNFPQAYVHIALINSSLLRSEWAASRKKIDTSIKRKAWF